jgi:hypothetical protein
LLIVKSAKANRINNKFSSSKKDFLKISLNKIVVRGRENAEMKKRKEEGRCGIILDY